MNEPAPSLLARFGLAWRLLFDATFATRVIQLDTRAEVATAPPPTPLHQARPDSALQLLGLLQQTGRLIDFLQEDVSGFSDADIGGAARVVHQGCRQVLVDYVKVEPISERAEGERLTLEDGFDAASYRLTGNVVGQAPFNGTLAHRGWRAEAINLPKLTAGHDVAILAPAEVEL